MIKDNQTEKPIHYKTQTESFDVIDFNKAYDLNFNLGNVVKYVARAGKKDNESKQKDLIKAIDYLKRELGAETKGEVNSQCIDVDPNSFKVFMTASFSNIGLQYQFQKSLIKWCKKWKKKNDPKEELNHP